MTDVLKPNLPESKKNEKKSDVNQLKKAEDELTEEDRLLQEELDMMVERLREPDQSLYGLALTTLQSLIKASTTSMTSVPKPLKFMRNHYPILKEVYEKIIDPKVKSFCADVISVLAMTVSEGRECLKYKMLGLDSEIGEWGHEYVRHLAGEIAQEWSDNLELAEDGKARLLALSEKIMPYNLTHNAEAEACDLAMELENVEMIEKFVDEDTHQRVCAYLISCVSYVPDPENKKLLDSAIRIYKKFSRWPQALRCALQLNQPNLVESIIELCPDEAVRKQLAFMVGRQQIKVSIPSDISNEAELHEIVSNSLLNQNFMALGRELDILEPKTPDEVYKSHLVEGNRHTFGSQVDSARQNLAASFVSGFVNAGFGKDKLLTEDGNKWLYKNKEHGMLSATASMGLILLWDVDGGLGQIDKYLYSAEDYIKAGALLACGIVNCGVRNECDPAFALLSDYVSHQSPTMKVGAILGLGLAYCGTNKEDVLQLLSPILMDSSIGIEVMSLAALSSGLISVGCNNSETTNDLLACLLERTEADMNNSYARFIALALGLCVLGKQEAAETLILALEVIPEPFRSMACTLVEVCAYAGTGNVLKIQKLLHICSEHYEPSSDSKSKDDDRKKSSKDSSKSKLGSDANDKEKPGSSRDTSKNTKSEGTLDLSMQQAVATLGIALIAMGEEIGTEMCFRTFGHLLRYCEPPIRRAVPLALGLLSVSYPRLNVLDTLSKFSHDVDQEVTLNSIFALGLVGAGTNNARVAAMLRQLSQFHAKDSNNLFMVRIAQGLVHLGKGTMSLSPFHSDRQLMSPVAVAGLMSTLMGFLDVKGLISGRAHYLLYCLATAMNPRMLATFDEELKPLPVSVRVGQALDIVGVAGKPKTITGFQTYTTPVLIGHGERAELATDDYIPMSPILEGFVILKKNPDAQ